MEPTRQPETMKRINATDPSSFCHLSFRLTTLNKPWWQTMQREGRHSAKWFKNWNFNLYQKIDMTDGHVLLGMCLRDSIHIKEDSPTTGEETLSGSMRQTTSFFLRIDPSSTAINSPLRLLLCQHLTNNTQQYSSGRWHHPSCGEIERRREELGAT